ncbi:MAG: hypothetical protein HY323_05445 [Betaproteobacteria bacterium]|nr:hypothetical protein [Betaproteobacteria bacterium]
MSDMLDEALAQMDETLGIQPEASPEEPPSDTDEAPADQASTAALVADSSGRLHGPDGKFVPKDAAASAAEAEAKADSGEPDAVEAYLAKYGGDRDQALRAAVEAQSTIGRQAFELGELRKTLDTLNERLSPAEPEEPAVQINQSTVDWFDEQSDQNPAAAAVWALENDPSGVLYGRALDAWHERAPRQAAAFERSLELSQLRSEFEQRLSDQTRPLQEQASKAGIAGAWAEARNTIPDLDSYGSQILEAAKEAPDAATGLRSDDPADRVKAIRALYYMAKGMTADAVSTRAAEAAAEDAAAARQAKQAAGVAVSSQSGEAEQVDEQEQWLRANFDPYAGRYMAKSET